MDKRLELEIKMVKDHFLHNQDEFVGFEVREKKSDEVKTKWDRSKWIYVVYKRNGYLQYTKASHNNNQKVNIKSKSYFVTEWEHLKGVAE